MPQPDQPALSATTLCAMLWIRNRHDQLPHHKSRQADRKQCQQRIAEQSAPDFRQRAGRSVRLLPPHGRKQCKESER